MRIRNFTDAATSNVAVLLLALLVVSVASDGLAQESGGLERAEGTPTSPAPSPAPAEPEVFDPDAPPPGTEVRVVVAGESESAAAYAQGDSITGFNAADLEALGALNIADLADFTPNLEIVTAGSTTPTFFIRGVGLNDFNSNSSGAVAIYQDDVAINSPALQLGTIFDVENVSVLRGPVGTGPARNASAGAIKVYSRKPRGTYNGYLRSSYGRYDYLDFEGAVESPIYEDILMGRLAFRVSQRDGYQRNACGGKPPTFDPITGQPLRVQYTSGPNTTDRAPFSLCGEDVPRRGFNRASGYSPLPANLPTDVNDLGNWATRGTFRFQPTLDQDWLINGHAAKREEYSRLGISYGTNGRMNFPDGSFIDGRLGAGDSNNPSIGGFIRPEVRELSRQYFDVLSAPLRAVCGSSCTNQQLRPYRDAADIAVANTIGQDLDFDPYTGYYNKVGETRNLTYGGYLHGEIAMPAHLVFTTTSGYDAYDRFISTDTDQSPNVLFEITTEDEGWQFYQNLDLEGALESLPVEWNIGGYYLQEQLDVHVDNDFGALSGVGNVAERDYTQYTWSFAFYGKFEWEFWDDFTLDGGVRYNWEKKSIDYELIRRQVATDFQTRRRSAPTGEVRLTYNFRDDTHVYWKYTRGWKGGHFNATASLRQGVTYAEPEENNAYETGIRGSWFDNKIGMDVSFFYYDYSNYQLFTVQNDFGANPEFVVLNASDVQVLGTEVELTARPWDNTQIQARFGWLESKFIDFVQRQVVQIPSDAGPITTELDNNFSGNRLLNSPQFKVSLSAQHTVQLGRYGSLTGRYDAAWTDTTYFDPTQGRGLPNRSSQFLLPPDTIGQKPYWLHNLLFIYRPPIAHVSIEFYVRNVTDEVYKTFAFDAVGFQNTTVYFTGEPRMYGGTLTFNY